MSKEEIEDIEITFLQDLILSLNNFIRNVLFSLEVYCVAFCF